MIKQLKTEIAEEQREIQKARELLAVLNQMVENAKIELAVKQRIVARMIATERKKR